jgi:hypothetical protein
MSRINNVMYLSIVSFVGCVAGSAHAALFVSCQVV